MRAERPFFVPPNTVVKHRSDSTPAQHRLKSQSRFDALGAQRQSPGRRLNCPAQTVNIYQTRICADGAARDCRRVVPERYKSHLQ